MDTLGTRINELNDSQGMSHIVSVLLKLTYISWLDRLKIIQVLSEEAYNETNKHLNFRIDEANTNIHKLENDLKVINDTSDILRSDLDNVTLHLDDIVKGFK